MELLSLFSRQVDELPQPIPAGSFTINRNGQITASTLPSSFPNSFLNDIAQHILTTFQEARSVELPLTELAINYPDFKLAARELTGGAIIFFIPR
ncbi:MAG: hypothetical protein HY301_14270 [Verrucomicrobia bacterium]|nr:hypothetical protein [Verrucomicrobiota bacterium]